MCIRDRSYIVIFAMMAAAIRTPQQVRRVVSTAIVASIPVALYGLLQHFGHDPLPWGGNVQERVAGNMGNAIFIAAYLIMVVPLTLARIVDAVGAILGDERLSAADVVRAAAYLFILAIQLLTIYWSGSRGPLIGPVSYTHLDVYKRQILGRFEAPHEGIQENFKIAMAETPI